MKIEKVKKLVANLHDKTGYVIHIIHLKQELNHGSVFKKVHKVIKFTQNAWLKPYTDMNTELRKTMKNVTKHRYIKLVTTEIRTNYLVSEPNYHTTKSFTENVLAIEMKKTEILMNKPVCLGLSILSLSKI